MYRSGTMDPAGLYPECLEVTAHIVEEGNGKSEGVGVVSLDIAIAFGTLPFAVIRESLRYHEVHTRSSAVW